MKTPRAARERGARPRAAARSARKCGEPISSSPSATSTRLTGSFCPAPRMACSAARKRGLAGPSGSPRRGRSTTLPKPGLSTSAASERRRGPLGGIDLLDVVHEVEADAFAARPRRAWRRRRAGRRSGRWSTCWKPASRASRIMSAQPSSIPRFSAAIEGCADPLLQALRRPRRGASRSRPGSRRARPRRGRGGASRARRPSRRPCRGIHVGNGGSWRRESTPGPRRPGSAP